MTLTAAHLPQEIRNAEDVSNACAIIRAGFIQMRSEIGKVIVGQERVVDLILVAILADGHVLGQLQDIRQHLREVQREAGQGALLRDGMTVVIAGRPNAGKSSLLNQLPSCSRSNSRNNLPSLCSRLIFPSR